MSFLFWNFIAFLDQFNASIVCGYCEHVVLVSFRNPERDASGDMVVRVTCPNCSHEYVLRGQLYVPQNS